MPNLAHCPYPKILPPTNPSGLSAFPGAHTPQLTADNTISPGHAGEHAVNETCSFYDSKLSTLF